MIMERADRLVELIARQRELSAQVHQLEGFRGQLQHIQQAKDRLAPLVRTWRLFRERGIGGAVGDERTVVLLQQVKQMRERFDVDRTSILGPNRLASLRGVHTLANELQIQLMQQWQEYAAARVPSVNEEVLNVLSRIAVLRSAVDAVWTGLRNLNERLQRLPTGAEDVDAFEVEAGEVRRRWDAFDTGHLPPEVLQFLKDAGGAGAVLDALTGTVRDWLGENELASAFRIRSISGVIPNR